MPKPAHPVIAQRAAKRALKSKFQLALALEMKKLGKVLPTESKDQLESRALRRLRFKGFGKKPLQAGSRK